MDHISSFHNDIAIFVVEEIKEDFIYRYANRFYCQIMNLKFPLQQGHRASHVFNEIDFIELKKYSSDLKKKYDYVKFEKIATINQIKTPLTVTMFSLNVNNTYLIACTIAYSELYIYEYQLNKKFSYVAAQSDSHYLSFTLYKNELNQYIITDTNKSFSNYFGINKMVDNSNIATVFPYTVSEFLIQGLVESLNEKIPVNKNLIYICNEYDINNFYCPAQANFFINVTFIPINKNDPLSCLCLVKDVSKDLNLKRDRDELILEYNTIFSTSINPIAILRVFDSDLIKLEKQNKRMEVFLNRFPHFLSLVFQEHENFKQLINDKNRIESMITFTIHDNSYQIQVNIDPIIDECRVSKIIITILNVNSSKNKNDLTHYVYLTKREKEIVSMVAQGQKNDYIATKLGISTGTVKKTLSNVYKKYSITSRVELMKYYLNEQS